MTEKKNEIKKRRLSSVESDKNDRVRIEMSLESMTYMAFIAYFVGHIGWNIDQATRARALRIAMDFHNCIRKRDDELADYLDYEAEAFYQRHQEIKNL